MTDEPLRRWIGVVQASEGYPPPNTGLLPKEQTPIELRLDSVLRVVDIEGYLDEQIIMWRNLRDSAGPSYRERTVAQCYIDAFQSVRLILLGEMLSRIKTNP